MPWCLCRYPALQKLPPWIRSLIRSIRSTIRWYPQTKVPWRLRPFDPTRGRRARETSSSRKFIFPIILQVHGLSPRSSRLPLNIMWEPPEFQQTGSAWWFSWVELTTRVASFWSSGAVRRGQSLHYLRQRSIHPSTWNQRPAWPPTARWYILQAIVLAGKAAWIFTKSKRVPMARAQNLLTSDRR